MVILADVLLGSEASGSGISTACAGLLICEQDMQWCAIGHWAQPWMNLGFYAFYLLELPGLPYVQPQERVTGRRAADGHWEEMEAQIPSRP